MVDLRKELASIIEDYGSNFLLIRLNKKTICVCVSKHYGAAKSDCPICLGIGFLHQATNVRGRSAFAAIPETLPRMINTGEPGNIAVPSKQFYLNYLSRPNRQDLIVVCEWDENGRPVFDEYTEIFQINEVDPNKGDNGRIEYFIASAKGDPINAKVRLASLSKNSKIDYYVSVGDL